MYYNPFLGIFIFYLFDEKWFIIIKIENWDLRGKIWQRRHFRKSIRQGNKTQSNTKGKKGEISFVLSFAKLRIPTDPIIFVFF